ncbi:MAG: DUF2202 domain-containing protein, partial [Spirochaetia bacterium]|nr:DUF2202 domain-containing protein [Spirochaetia bacterium]
MNIYRKAIIASMTAALMATGMLGAQGVVDSSEFTSSIESVVVEEAISSEEGILLMREEEKLARDVYLTLYEKWNLRTFSNIARAEQKHMDAVAYLLSTKGIEDPVKEAKIG